MPVYIVQLEKGLNEADYEAAHQHARDQGGKITTYYEREGPCPGFAVEFPADAMTTLEKAPNVMTVEREGEAKTQ